MNNANPRRSLRLKEKYKTDLGLVRDLLEEKLDSLTSPSRSQLTCEGSSKTLQSPLSKPTPKIAQMANREEVIDDNEEWVDRREHRV